MRLNRYHRRFIKDNPDVSPDVLALLIGCSKHTVIRYRQVGVARAGKSKVTKVSNDGLFDNLGFIGRKQND